MKSAEPRKLFGRPSSLLLDEQVLPGVPPAIRVEPPRPFAPPADGLGGMKIRSVASLPDDLDDEDELEEDEREEDDDAPGTPDEAQDADDAWGAAFEVDDFRAARREDPDADLLTGPATIRMTPPPSAQASDDEEEMIGMPEEGDEPELTGVGEQVALPEGFDDGLFLAGDDGDDGPEESAPEPPPVASPGPGPFEAMRRGPAVGFGLGVARVGAAPPRVLTEDPVEGLAVAWMSASSGGSDDLPEIVEDHHTASELRREARQALLDTAVLGEPQRRSRPPTAAPVDPAPWSPETAPGPEATSRPVSPSRTRTSVTPLAPNPGADLIPDAVSALAEALERDPAPSEGTGPRARRSTGEPPRISRRTREEPAPPAVPPRRRPLEMETSPRDDGAPPRRLARPTLSPGATSESEPPRRARPAPGVDARTRDPSTDTAPRPRRSLSPVVMPAPSFAPAETPQPQPAPRAQAVEAARSRTAPSPTAPRSPARVRAPRPAAKPKFEFLPPLLIGVGLIVVIIGLLAVVIPREPSDPAAPPQATGPAVVEVALPTPARVILPIEPAPAPVPAPILEALPEPVVVPPPVSKPSEKASAYKIALGIIRVSSDRKALIIVDGKQQGYAPGLADISVMPGQHTVRAVVSGTGLSRSLEIRVDAGSAVVASFSFED